MKGRDRDQETCTWDWLTSSLLVPFVSLDLWVNLACTDMTAVLSGLLSHIQIINHLPIVKTCSSNLSFSLLNTFCQAYILELIFQSVLWNMTPKNIYQAHNLPPFLKRTGHTKWCKTSKATCREADRKHYRGCLTIIISLHHMSNCLWDKTTQAYVTWSLRGFLKGRSATFVVWPSTSTWSTQLLFVESNIFANNATYFVLAKISNYFSRYLANPAKNISQTIYQPIIPCWKTMSY